MNKKLLIAVLASMVSGIAIADNAFNKVDSDRSGTISKQEAASLPALSEQWDAYDLNTDGKLDEAEFARFELMEPENAEKEKEGAE